MSEKPMLTVADRMWDEIKHLSMDLFSLPNQKVEKYFIPKPIDVNNKLYLVHTAAAPAALPALETVLKGRFNVEKVDKYIIVTRV